MRLNSTTSFCGSRYVGRVRRSHSRASPFLGLTPGSASLHPGLYAVARVRELRVFESGLMPGALCCRSHSRADLCCHRTRGVNLCCRPHSRSEIWNSDSKTINASRLILLFRHHRFPQLYLVPVRVHYPCELSVEIRIRSFDNLDTILLQRREQFVHVIDAVVDHE